jgi:hypothetical protein
MQANAATEGSLPRQWCLGPKHANVIVQYNNNTAISMSYIGVGAFATVVMIIFFGSFITAKYQTKLQTF